MLNQPQSIANEMLLANAGSGKTYALTSRIIRLLLGDQAKHHGCFQLVTDIANDHQSFEHQLSARCLRQPRP